MSFRPAPPYSPSLCLSALLCISSTPAIFAADDPTSNTASPAKADKPSEEILVIGNRPNPSSERRNSVAGKIIIGRDEIERFGENTVGGLLRRLPGVSYSGNPGRPSEIKMRGLGGGYTQILIDGERVPPRAGRSVGVDMLSADMIERIEIIRNPVAEYSAQAVAGTINIVLREDAQKKSTSLRLAINAEGGRINPQIYAQYSDKAGGFSYTLSGSALRRGQINDSQRAAEERDSNHVLRLDERESSENRGNTTEYSFAPRLSWRIPGGNNLSLQTFIMHAQSINQSESILSRSTGGAPPYRYAQQRSDGLNEQVRLMGMWNQRDEAGNKLAARLSFSSGQNDSNSYRTEQDANYQLSRTVDEQRNVRTGGANGGLKWTTPIAEVHALTLGFDVSKMTRRETRRLRDTQLPTASGTGDTVQSSETQYAVFAQGEWQASERINLNTGLRWERADLNVEDISGTRTQSPAVLSPSLNTIWRLDDKKTQQLRFSFSRSFKLPNLSDLSPRLVQSLDNGPSKPDTTGNTGLKPEIAWGIETAYEYYLAEGGVLSANLFGRDITNLIRRRTSFNAGRWQSQPLNVAKASSYGVELEAKMRLDALFDGAPPIDIKSNYSRFTSRIDDLPGPNNRLDEQPSALANLGADYRFASLPLSIGGNYNWTAGYNVRASEIQSVEIGAKKVLDVFAVWHINKDNRLRLSVGNVTETEMGRTTQTQLTASNGNRIETSASATWQIWNLALELKF